MKGLIIVCTLMLAACSSTTVSTSQPTTFKHAYGDGYIESSHTMPAPPLRSGYSDTREAMWLDATADVLIALLELYVHGHVTLGQHTHHPHD